MKYLIYDMGSSFCDVWCIVHFQAIYVFPMLLSVFATPTGVTGVAPYSVSLMPLQIVHMNVYATCHGHIYDVLLAQIMNTFPCGVSTNALHNVVINTSRVRMQAEFQSS